MLNIENAHVDGARKSARQEAKQAGPLGMYINIFLWKPTFQRLMTGC